jgi:hypothetical protein
MTPQPGEFYQPRRRDKYSRSVCPHPPVLYVNAVWRNPAGGEYLECVTWSEGPHPDPRAWYRRFAPAFLRDYRRISLASVAKLAEVDPLARQLLEHVESGSDPYMEAARKLGVPRKLAKTFTFGEFWGGPVPHPLQPPRLPQGFRKRLGRMPRTTPEAERAKWAHHDELAKQAGMSRDEFGQALFRLFYDVDPESL